MSDQRIKIPRTSDQRIAEVFRALSVKYQVNSAGVSTLGFGHVQVNNLQAEPDGDWKSLLDHDSFLIDSISLQACGLNVAYVRGGRHAADQKSAVYDEVVITANNQQQASIAQKLELIAFLNTSLRSFEPGRLPGSDVNDAQSQLMAIHQSTLERLEKLNEDLVRQSTAFRQKLEDQYDSKVQSYEQDLREKLDGFETDYEKRLAEVDTRDETLQAKLSAIDDRDNTHVRREIRDRMLEDVKQRISKFGVSVTTERKRVPVFLGIAVLVSTFVVLLIWTALEISAVDRLSVSISAAVQDSTAASDKTGLYLLWIRFTLFSLGLVGTLLYYIKWQNKWAEQHSNSEFQLQQFYIDVNRANWVIESCLEWRKDTDSPIPRELLASITNGLFVNNQVEPEKIIHPADELASALMGSASKLKLKVGDSELEFDKPNKITNKALAVNA